MNRLVNKVISSVLAISVSASLAACGGGSHSASLPRAVPPPTSAPAAAYTGPLADATFVITIPVPKTSSTTRKPAYVSSSTSKIVFTLNSATIAGMSGATLATFNTTVLGAKAVTLGSATCPGAGPWTCTLAIKLPPGTDNLTMSAQDSSSNILSQQIQNLTVVAGTANAFTTTLDANVAAMTVSGTAACASGPVGASFGSVGTTAVNFTVAHTDAATKTIIAPGLPILAIQDNASVWQTSSGTITGTGGTVGFVINQAAQTFQLTPSAVPITNATVNVRATPKNTNGTSDGLVFIKNQSFVFSTGPAPPPSFLAVIEQTGANSGKIDLFTVALGATDTFTPYTVSGGGTSLAVTNSTNEGKPDVDNPRDILFDSNGNLLIANGGQGGAIVAGSPDYGDFACVPAGAIATGSTTTTTSSGNAYDPESIAIGTDSSVAMANVPAGAAYNLVEYLLGSTYTAAPVGRDIANPGNLVGATSVIALPSLGTGTFGVAITNGTTSSKVAMKFSNGTQTDITDPEISSPEGLGWDANLGQLAIVNHTITTIATIPHNTSKLLFFTLGGTPTKVKTVQLGSDPTTPSDSYQFGDRVAVAADGHVAVAGGTADGPAEVRVFDNTAARGAVGVAIPFDAYTSNTCVTGYYGSVTVVRGMRWLSNNKLLVLISSNIAAKQGAYTFDINQLVATPGLFRYDVNGGSCNAVAGNSPKQTGFQVFTNVPLGAAFKP